MTKEIPRATIEEIEARWKFANLKLLVVEGVGDQRYFDLLRKEDYCLPGIKDVDVWSVDRINVSSAIVMENGFIGTGNKQRAVSLMRTLERNGAEKRFQKSCG